MLEPKISVIIPVYNTEKWLRQCLDSLRFQTYHNLEFICIDDGSTDDSLKVLEEYKALDDRFLILHQENSGVSVTRNRGIAASTGEYISCIDSDDWVRLDLYQNFVDKLNTSGKMLDIYVFNVAAYVEGYNDIMPRVFFDMSDWQVRPDNIYTFNDCVRPFSRNLSAANKIYRKAFLADNEIVFPEGISYEDQYFCIKAFLYAKSIAITDDIFYRYRNCASVSCTLKVSEAVFDIFKIVDIIEGEIFKLNRFEAFKYALFQYKFNVFPNHYSRCPENLKQKYYDEMKTRLLEAERFGLDPKIYTRLRNYEVFQVIKNNDKQGYERLLKHN